MTPCSTGEEESVGEAAGRHRCGDLDAPSSLGARVACSQGRLLTMRAWLQQSERGAAEAQEGGQGARGRGQVHHAQPGLQQGPLPQRGNSRGAGQARSGKCAGCACSPACDPVMIRAREPAHACWPTPAGAGELPQGLGGQHRRPARQGAAAEDQGAGQAAQRGQRPAGRGARSATQAAAAAAARTTTGECGTICAARASAGGRAPPPRSALTSCMTCRLHRAPSRHSRSSSRQATPSTRTWARKRWRHCEWQLRPRTQHSCSAPGTRCADGVCPLCPRRSCEEYLKLLADEVRDHGVDWVGMVHMLPGVRPRWRWTAWAAQTRVRAGARTRWFEVWCFGLVRALRARRAGVRGRDGGGAAAHPWRRRLGLAAEPRGLCQLLQSL